jgi:hypothetical protein
MPTFTAVVKFSHALMRRFFPPRRWLIARLIWASTVVAQATARQRPAWKEEIPIFRYYGPSNIFSKWKEVLANNALHENGDIGMLIETREIFFQSHLIYLIMTGELAVWP